MRFSMLLVGALLAVSLPCVAGNPIRIVGEGGTRELWTPASGVRFAMPAYPAAYAGNPESVCVAMGYLLNADGHASDFALLKSWSSGNEPRSQAGFWRAFAEAASGALAQRRMVPRAGIASPEPVYTVATFAFGPGEAAGVREHCAISDLSARLLELRYNRRAGRLMARGIFSKLDIDPGEKDRIRQQAMIQGEDFEHQRMSKTTNDERQLPPPISDH